MTRHQVEALRRASIYKDPTWRWSDRDSFAKRVYNFETHESLIAEHHSELSKDEVYELAEFIGNVWSVEITILFSAVSKNYREAEGWGFAPKKGAIQIPEDCLSTDWVIHEASHAVVESWRFLRPTHKRIESNHGPVYQSVLAMNYSHTYSVSSDGIKNAMDEFGLCPICPKYTKRITKVNINVAS